jgi:signal transduction histidine kinase
VNLIETATYFSAATNLALAFSYLFIWRTVLRRRYVALFALNGVCGVAELLFLIPVHLSGGRAHGAYLAASTAAALGAVSWIGGCYDFVRRRLPVVVLGIAFAALMAWSAVAPEVTSGFLARESGDSLIKGALGLWIAWVFWRGPRFPARAALATLFTLQGLHQLDYPILADKSWGLVTGLAISNFLGISIALFLMMIVIDEARQETMLARESLRRAEAMAEMGELVGGVAHEVRNPLTAISAGLQTLSATEPEVMARHGELLRELRFALERLTSLTRDLLVYGKPTAPDLARADAGDVARQAVSACITQARLAQVTLSARADGAFPVTVDAPRMVQVFVNLVTNAVQHAPAGSEVTVTVRLRGNGRGPRIECEVADRGPGFPPDLLPHLFHPFASRRAGGTGLGLAIARRLVEQQHGEIAAENRPEGGALVRVTLPMAADASRSAA